MAKWLRPLSHLEVFIAETSAKYNCFNLTIALQIAVSEPITEEQFRRAFSQLLIKCENLRSSIKNRDGKLWFAEAEETKLDMLQIIRGRSAEEVKKELRNIKLYPSSNYHWEARILDHGVSENEYTIFFHYCHSIVDGLTTVKIFKTLLKLLENELSEDKEDVLPIGQLIHGSQLDHVIKDKENELLKDPTHAEESWGKFLKMVSAVDPLMNKIFKNPQGDCSPETLHDSLSELDTNVLISKCKANGVTVNSAITGSLTAAYITLLQRMGIVQKSYKIVSSHWASFRRHMQNGDQALGCVLGNYIHAEAVSPQINNSFWSYVKTLHSDLHIKVTGEEIVKQEALKEMNNFSLDIDSEETPFYAYHLSNYTKLDLGEEGKIKLLDLSRENVIARGLVCIMFVFYTFKGKLIAHVDYIPGYIEQSMVKVILGESLSFLSKSI